MLSAMLQIEIFLATGHAGQRDWPRLDGAYDVIIAFYDANC